VKCREARPEDLAHVEKHLRASSRQDILGVGRDNLRDAFPVDISRRLWALESTDGVPLAATLLLLAFIVTAKARGTGQHFLSPLMGLIMILVSSKRPAKTS